MSRATLAVVCDQLRALGLEDVARWVEHPDAVRELLKHTAEDSIVDDDGYSACPACEERLLNDLGEAAPHGRTCPIAAAWRALGDPRGQADIERAHEEALEQGRIERGRSPGEPIDFNLNDPREQRWVALSRTTDGRIAQAAQLVADGLITQDQVRRILDYPLAVGGIVVTR